MSTLTGIWTVVYDDSAPMPWGCESFECQRFFNSKRDAERYLASLEDYEHGRLVFAEDLSTDDCPF